MPPPKKRVKSSKKVDEEDSEVESEVEAGGSKPVAPSTTPGTAFKEKDGTKGWELGSKRRITVSKFKGKKYVGIREYYEDNGKLLPGKRGLNLSPEQFETLLSLQEEVKKALEEE